MFVDTTALREQVIDDVIALGLRLGRPALLGAAPAVRAERHRRRADRGPGRRHGRPGGRRPGRPDDRHRPGDRRGRQGGAGRAPRAAASARPRSSHRARRRPTRRAASSSARCWPRSRSADFLEREVFGPILHVVRYDPDEPGGGRRRAGRARLRPDARRPQPHRALRRARSRALVPAGNVYVNRSMIGAVVGVQPFGGEGLSRHRPQGRRPARPAALRRRARASASTSPPRAATRRC